MSLYTSRSINMGTYDFDLCSGSIPFFDEEAIVLFTP